MTAVQHWGFADRAIGEQRAQLAAKFLEALAAGVDMVVAPFPYDAHADHVAVALALADALERAPGQLPIVLCAPVRLRCARVGDEAGAGWSGMGAAARGGRLQLTRRGVFAKSSQFGVAASPADSRRGWF